MQVRTARIEQAADVARAFDVPCERGAIEQFEARITIGAGQQLAELTQLRELARLDRDVQLAITPVAVDCVPGDPLADLVDRLDRPVEQQACVGGRCQRGERRHFARIAEDQLPTAAARSAPADPVCLEQRHVETPFGEFQCGGKPGQAAANDTHVAVDFTLERGAGRRREHRRSVIRAHVRFGRGTAHAGENHERGEVS